MDHTTIKEKTQIEKGIMKVLMVKYEKSTYSPEFVAKINKGKADVKDGKTTKISIDEICK